MEVHSDQTKAHQIISEFMRITDAASYLGISKQLLMKQIRLGSGPRKRHVGRVAIFKRTDLDAWMEAQ